MFLEVADADHRNLANKASINLAEALSVLGIPDFDVYSFPEEDVDAVRIELQTPGAYRLAELLMTLEDKT